MKMPPILLKIFLILTIAFDVISAGGLIAFTVFSFLKLSLPKDPLKLEECENCSIYIQFIRYSAVAVTGLFCLNLIFNLIKKYVMKYRFLITVKMICCPATFTMIFNLLSFRQKIKDNVVEALFFSSIAIISCLFVSFVLETVYISILTEKESKARTQKFGLPSKSEEDELSEKIDE